MVNDPATYPFLRSSQLELAAAGINLKNGSSSRSHAIPVAPSAVKWHLWSHSGNGSAQYGIIDVAAYACMQLKHPWFKTKLRWFEPGAFVLIDGDASSESRYAALQSLKVDHEVIELVEKLVEDGVLSSWCWVQYRNSSCTDYEHVIIWDATNSPPIALPSNPSYLQSVVHVVLFQDSNFNWTVKTYSDRDRGGKPPQTSVSTDASEPSIGSGVTLTPCVITSTSTRHLKHVSASWPNRVENVELYCLMQTDVDALTKILRRQLAWDGLGRTAMEFLSEIYDNEPALALVARYLLRGLERNAVRCRAIASFFPTLSFPSADFRGEMAEQALISTQKLASIIRKQGNHDVRVVEAVAGSRVHGVWPGLTSTGKFRFWANIGDVVAAQSHVLQRLRNVKEHLDNRGFETTPLAIELEPGSLFTVGSWKNVLSICRLLEGDDLGSWVGVNLDISHWRIAGIPVEQVARDRHVFSRIIHAHISGHHPGAHFGDIGFRNYSHLKDFQPWIDVLKERMKISSQIKYSELISLELEACKRPLVSEAWQDLEHLLL